MELLRAVWDHFASHFTGGMTYRTWWVYLLCAAALAMVVYVRREGRTWSLIGYARYLFPKDVWLHRSARVDYGYFLLNGLVMLLFVTPMIVWVYPAAVSGLMTGLAAVGAPSWPSAPGLVWMLYLLAMFLVIDFGIFLAHTLQHKSPFLWQFHKTHHAAEVLNPMTLYRQHPVDFLLSGVIVGAGMAIVQAGFSWTFSTPFARLTVAGMGLGTLLFYVFGYNLRHSHVRLSFGKLDKWFISPEQHQLHHSCVPAHFDRNMGLILAFWDRLFRSHYLPDPDEEIVLGLPDGEADDFANPWACLARPVVLAVRTHTRALIAGVAAVMALGGAAMAVDDEPLPSLHLDELTWVEVQTALERGHTSVIIPTGGTEQNGRHATLGKHNRVVRHTAERIAADVGNTLVAPVMAYVPEGDIETREGHMAFAGTLSLRESTFELVLEDTVESLLAHGFTEVLLVGDSGSSVAVQEKVETAFEGREGVRVLHVDGYYSGNGQTDWLVSQGYTPVAVGSHAGIRDTSELMAVSPGDIRDRERFDPDQAAGATGAFWTANTEIGQKMLDLKVEAAVAQIREARKG